MVQSSGWTSGIIHGGVGVGAGRPLTFTGVEVGDEGASGVFVGLGVGAATVAVANGGRLVGVASGVGDAQAASPIVTKRPVSKVIRIFTCSCFLEFVRFAKRVRLRHAS